MALVSKLTPKRIPIPHEPGEWIEMLPPTVEAVETVGIERTAGMTVRESSAGLLAKCVKSWSYDAPIQRETFYDLDNQTWEWLIETINSSAHVPDAEKKASNNGSSHTMAPEAEASPVSSLT